MYTIRQLTASMNVQPQMESKLIGQGLPEHINCVNQQDTCLLGHISKKITNKKGPHQNGVKWHPGL